ncbi:MAG: AzlD domain-containing protein [Gordonia sp. (in: high G+C Gram-positive bacteria)]|uniref:AzlD domain-containing protein n=1 Tax=Gordonia sp. (in: high G+C Gram-positive bacteria) TaxID=84139 RepID=UPI0039E42D89
MPETGYLIGVLTTALVITFALRALPFAVLKPLRRSRFVLVMAAWMPAGILAILAAATFRDAAGDAAHVLPAIVAAAVTAAVHLAFGRRTLLSVVLGTLSYVLLLALL